MKRFFCLISVCITIFLLTGCNKKTDLDQISEYLNTYEITIDYNNETHSATANEILYYTNNCEDALKEIKFHLYPKFFTEGNTKYIISDQKMANLYPNGISFGTFNISRVTVDNKDTNFCYEGDCDDILIVKLDQTLLPNKSIPISIDFDFSLPNCSHRFGYLDDTVNLNNFYPVVCVYENNSFNTNPYNSNGDPFYSDISNYKIKLTCDKELVVASSGKDTIDTNQDKATHNISIKAVRDFGMVLSNHFKVESSKYKSTEINYYYYTDDNYLKSLSTGVDAIKTFSKMFGEYPYTSYSIVQSNFVFGGMEYPGLVMISDEVLDPVDYQNVIVHETAHQWWYGLVGNDEFTYPWLDEALAEFSCALFYKENSNYVLTYDEVMKTTRENYALFISVYQDVFGSIDTSMRAVDQFNTEPEYTYITYVKGMLMYDSLYKLIGKDKFMKAIKNYYEEYKFKFSTPKNLIDSFSASTKQDLNGFFSSWINGKVIIN